MKKKLIALVIIGLLISCSTEKDTFKNRAFHNSTAWLNTLFNAEKEMDKKLDELEFSFQDNYSEILPVDPRPEINGLELSDEFIDEMAKGLTPGKPNSSGSKSVSGFDLVEKKARKAIENHSMLINGKERNKSMTRAYLILGKANYHNGKGFEALEALNYLQKLPYHKKFTPEAKLYVALANYQIGNTFDGDRILEMLYKDDGYKRKFRENISKYYAQAWIDREGYEEAIKALDKTISLSKNKKRKARYYFIEAQLYSKLGMQNEAGETYTKVYKMKPGFEMEVKSQLGIAANFDPEKNSYNSYKEHLLDVAKKGNYVSRKNELYYAIGDIAIKANKVDEARKYLKESFVGRASDPYIRAKAYERYADLEFDQNNYVFASAYYDSAVAVAPYQKDIVRINERNVSLKSLMEKYYFVKRNDSILKLAHMSRPEQETYFGDYIAKLKIEDAKRQKQLEEEATIFQTQTKGSTGFDDSFAEGAAGNFYFYNNSLKSSGQNEFRKIWGNIKLADNWRSSAGASMSLEEKQAEMLGQGDTQNPRRYELSFYLEQIPTKNAELNKLKIQRDTTELSLGIGYYDLFANSKLATETLEHLLSTPPKEASTDAQALYQLYRINSKVENLAKAEESKSQILSKYPNSIYAQYILNPEVDYTTPTTKDALALYEETYMFYQDKNYADVRKNVNKALEDYPSEIIIAKFSLLNALTIGKTEDVDKFKEALELITVAYQNTDEAKKAQDILDLLNSKNKKNSDNQSQLSEEERKLEAIKAEEQQQKNPSNRNELMNPVSTPQRGNVPVNRSRPEEGAREVK